MPFQLVVINFIQLLLVIPKAIVLGVVDTIKDRRKQRELRRQFNSEEINFNEFIEKGGKFL
jgi:hypothetical protein